MLTISTVTALPLAQGFFSGTDGLTLGPDNNFWLTDFVFGSIKRFTPTGVTTTFNLPGFTGAQGVTAGPDGNIWFAENLADAIGRITPGGSITSFPIPKGTAPFIGPWGITAGPDGNLWFTERSANQIGRITPDGVITEFSMPTPNSSPGAITAGPDGNLWFTEIANDRIGRITPDGTITEFPIPTAGALVYSITAGFDGNLYFAEQFANKIGQIKPDGTITEFPIPTATSLPYGITAAPDGHIYFTEQGAVALGDLDPITGTIVETPLPAGTTQYDGFSQPYNIVVGPDNNLWFNDQVNNVVGRATIKYDIRLQLTPPTNAVEATPLTNVTVATFTDIQPGTQPSDYTATIDWGDGAGPMPATVVALGSGQGFAVQGSTTYQKGGTFPLRVSVSRAVGVSALARGTVSVAPIPLVASGTTLTGLQEGVPIGATTPLASFTDPRTLIQGTGSYTVSIDWGDGTQPSTGSVVTTGTPNQFNIIASPPHAFPGGTSTVTITIQGNNGATATVTTTVTAEDAALNTDPVPVQIQAVEGTPFNGVVALFTDDDPRQPGPGYYSAMIDWGDGSPPSPGTIDNNPSGGYEVLGSHVFRIGTHTITVAIKDSDVSTTTATATANIANAQITPRSVDVRTIEGQTFSGVVAGFTDANGAARGEDYLASIDWGDGTPPTPGRVSYEGDHQFTVIGSHVFAAGTHPITVSLSEPAAPGNEFTITGGVANVASTPLSASGAADFAGVEGVPVSALLATFRDANPRSQPGDYAATITWGDGTTSGGTVVRPDPTGDYQVHGSHAYTRQGTYAVGVEIRSLSGSRTTVGTSAQVGDAPITARGASISAAELAPFVTVVGTFTDANPNGRLGDYVASINWGDGTASPGAVVANPGGGFAVIGNHIYRQGGTYTVGLAVSDNGTSLGTASSTATVADKVYPLTGVLNPFTDTGLSPFDAITRLTQTNFLGKAEPGAVVTLFASSGGLTAPVPVGAGTADSLGNWNATTLPLPDGAYTIFASAVDADGRPSSPLTQLLPSPQVGPLIIDTVGPRVVSSALDPVAGRVVATFQDDGGGMNGLALGNGLNYSLASSTRRGTRPLPMTALSVTPLGSTRLEMVSATFGRGRLGRGNFVLTMASNGLTDLAGNTLDERTFISFPPALGRIGGDYVAQFSTDGRTPAAPQQYVPPGEINGATQFGNFLRDRLFDGRRLRRRR